MVIWNNNWIEVLRKYINNFSQSENKSVPFFVVSGPKNIWKSTIILDLVKDYLGQFFVQDFLYIRDFSDNIWKHNIKISTPKDSDKRFISFGESNIYEVEKKPLVNKSAIPEFKE